MLIEFSVQNFKSFKNKVTLSMEKDYSDENLQNTFKVNDLQLLKSAAIYGANASGKSNLIDALTTAVLLVRNSNLMTIDEKLISIKPFMLDDSSFKEPSYFEFVILINKVKYIYSFSADVNRILSEKLVAYYSQKPTSIFERNKNSYTFYGPDAKKLKTIEKRNLPNKLFLATATNWNYEKTKDVYLWFLNSIDTFDTLNRVNNLDFELLELYSKNNQELKEFTINLLKEADIKIKDFNVSYEEDIYKRSKFNIEVLHEVNNDDGKTNEYSLDFFEESNGTKTLFAIAPYLKRALSSPKVIIVDELERSLHPALIEFLIKIFHSKLNKVNSQLIFSTHAVNLLNLDIFRRDQIWFTEKNNENGITDLYSLSDFSVRKEENIQKGYLNGRYGAIPFIRDINLWEE